MNDLFVQTFLLKVAARCNIDCDYCYEYKLADQSWRSKPSRMPIQVLFKTIKRIKEHILSHELKGISIIFHGGEPLLAGKDFFEQAVTHINGELSSFCEVKFGMQSNGVLLDAEWANLLLRLKVGIGISIDGYKQLNDEHRLDYRGNSTFPRVEAAMKILSQPQYSEIRGGFLTVIQPESNPIKLLEWFRKFGKTQIDFLLPHYNHQRKPPSAYDAVHGYGYGLWLAQLFDYWWNNDIHEIKIRIFEDLMHLMIGGRYAVESFGLSPVHLAVIQTDGEYEAVDSLKSTYDGAVSTSKNISDHSFDDIFSEYLILSRTAKFENLPEKCRECRLVKACGGGYIPHRYHPVFGFNMPTIYCQDLIFLIKHIEKYLLLDEKIRTQLVEHIGSTPTGISSV
jgi:uncharacterized protein